MKGNMKMQAAQHCGSQDHPSWPVEKPESIAVVKVDELRSEQRRESYSRRRGDSKAGEVLNKKVNLGIANEYRRRRKASWEEKNCNRSPKRRRDESLSSIAAERAAGSPTGDPKRLATPGATERAPGNEARRLNSISALPAMILISPG